MAYFKTQDFISKVRKDDLARSNRFEIVINSPANMATDREVSLFCEEAQIPGLQIKWTPTVISTWTEQRAHGIEYFGDTAAFTFFTNPKVVYIGLISYSLYLWHWSVLSISRWTIGINFWSVPLQIALIFCLAVASFRFIETPLRKGKWFYERWKTLSIGGVVLLIISLILTMGKTILEQFYLGKRDNIVIPILNSSDESKLRRESCSIDFKIAAEDPHESCYKNNKQETSNTLIALVGDSMAKSLYSLIDIEDSENFLSTFYSARNSCFVPQPASSTNNCKKWSDKTIKTIKGLSNQHSKTIIIFNGWYQYYFNNSRSIFRPFLKASNDYEGYLKEISNLAEDIKRNGKNISLVLTMPVPMQSINPYPNCKKDWFRVNVSSNCKTGTLRKYANLNPRDIRNRFEEIASTNSNVYIFDPSKSLCKDEYCIMLNPKGDLLYTDDHHLSDYGTRYILPEFEIIKNIILNR